MWIPQVVLINSTRDTRADRNNFFCFEIQELFPHGSGSFFMLFSIVYMLFHCLMPASGMADKMPKKMNKSEPKMPKMLNY